MEMTPILAAENNLPVDELKKGMEVVYGGRQALVEGVNGGHGVAALRLRRKGKEAPAIVVVAFEATDSGVCGSVSPVMVFPVRKGAFARDMFSVVVEGSNV